MAKSGNTQWFKIKFNAPIIFDYFRNDFTQKKYLFLKK